MLNSLPVYAFREWAVYLEPLIGIILGPWLGIVTALIGGTISRVIVGGGLLSFIYGLTGEIVGVLVAGLLFKGRWRIVFTLYALMLVAYFIHPYGFRLPFWAILDCLIAFMLVYPAALSSKRFRESESKIVKSAVAIMLISFVSTVAHSLTMIFILVPMGTYALEFGSFESVYYVFVIGAAGSYFEDALVIVISLLVYAPVLTFLKRSKILNFPLS